MADKQDTTKPTASGNQADKPSPKSERLWYINDTRNCPVFEVTIKRDQYWETHCEFIVREITSWVRGENEQWDVPGDFEDYMEIDIKWDGCSHYRIGEFNEDGSRDAYLHLCGARYFKKHTELLRLLYDRAFKEMQRDPDNGAWGNDLELKDSELL